VQSVRPALLQALDRHLGQWLLAQLAERLVPGDAVHVATIYRSTWPSYSHTYYPSTYATTYNYGNYSTTYWPSTYTTTYSY
jgi:hypothetical protein